MKNVTKSLFRLLAGKARNSRLSKTVTRTKPISAI